MKTEVTVEIEAAPESIWEVMGDVEHWPEWTRSVDKVDLMDGEHLAVGGRARIKQPKMPAMIWTVTELTPASGFVWTTSAVGTQTVATHTILPTGQGSRVILSVEQSGALFSFIPWVKSMTLRYLEMETRGLKQRCEERALAK